jgi:hypothetical protein
MVYIFGQPSLDTLNLRATQLLKTDMELLATCLHNNPHKESRIRALNLSKNAILKEGAKILAPALAGNKSLEVLDLSQCNLGVSGTVAIANALKSNTKLKSLNLYRNRADVDGARALRELLKVNSTLEFLDVGHNRLREKGIIAITDGIVANPKSSIEHLGVRFNFINDDGFGYLFDKLILQGKTSPITSMLRFKRVAKRSLLMVSKSFNTSTNKDSITQFGYLLLLLCILSALRDSLSSSKMTWSVDSSLM